MHRPRLLLPIALVVLMATAPSAVIAQWQPGFEAPGFHGGVPHAGCAWNDGFAFGGTFVGAGTARALGVVYWDGSSFSALGEGLTPLPPVRGRVDGVQSLLDHEGLLVAGGAFEQSGATWVGCVAAFEGGQWQPLGAGLRGVAWELVSFAGEIIAIGDFVRPESETLRATVVAFDGANWRTLGEGPVRTRALAVHEGQLFAGAHRWTGASWEAIADLAGNVEAMISTNAGLVLGGTITKANGVDVFGIVRWDGVDTVALGDGNRICGGGTNLWGYERPGMLVDFALLGGELHALGTFMSIYCTGALPYFGDGSDFGEGWAFGLARFDGEEWVEIGAERDFLARMSDVGALVRDGETLLVLGDFTSAGDVLAAGIVRATANGEWQPIADGRGRLRRPDLLILSGDSPQMVEGEFEVHGVDAPIARFETPEAKCLGGFVVEANTYLFGYYYDLGDVGPVLQPIAWSFDGGQFVLPGFDEVTWDETRATAGVNWPEHGIALAREGIPAFGPEIVPLLLQLHDRTSGTIVSATSLGIPDEGAVPCPVTNAYAGGLVVHGDVLVTAWNGRVVHWDGTSGLPPEPYWYGEIASAGLDTLGTAVFDAPVTSIASLDGRLFVGGSFTHYGDAEVPYLAEWNGTTWVAPAEGAPNGPVHVLHVSPLGDLWVGGDFTTIGNAPSSHLAVRRNDVWGLFPDGPDGRVTAIAADEQGVWIIGDFTSSGGHAAHHLARWTGDVTTVGIADPRDDGSTPDGESPIGPRRVELSDPYPNPFNPRVEFAYRLPAPTTVRLEILDLAGRRVRELAVRDEAAGTHNMAWDGVDDANRPVASGTYFLRLTTPEGNATTKLVLVR